MNQRIAATRTWGAAEILTRADGLASRAQRLDHAANLTRGKGTWTGSPQLLRGLTMCPSDFKPVSGGAGCVSPLATVTYSASRAK